MIRPHRYPVLSPVLLLAVLAAFLGAGCSSGETRDDEPAVDERDLHPHLEALDSKDSRRRLEARETILAMGPAVCRSLSREVRHRTESDDTGPGFICLVRLLGALGGVDAVRPLTDVSLKRPLDASVRVEAVRALATTGDGGAVRALAECAGAEEPMALRLAAIRALSLHAGADAARRTLQDHLCTGTGPVRSAAARSLLAIDDVSLRPLFRLRLLDADPAVRSAAVAWFQLHPDPEAEILLRLLAKKDRDFAVAMAAGKALEALSRKKG